LAIGQGKTEVLLEVIGMMGVFSVFCFLWLIGLTIFAEVLLYEEEQHL